METKTIVRECDRCHEKKQTRYKGTNFWVCNDCKNTNNKNFGRCTKRSNSVKREKSLQNDFSVLANNLEDMREQMEELKKMRSELKDLKNIVEEEEKINMEVKDNFRVLIESFSEFNDKNEMEDGEKRRSMIPLITDFLEKTKMHDLTGKMDTVIKIIKMMK